MTLVVGRGSLGIRVGLRVDRPYVLRKCLGKALGDRSVGTATGSPQLSMVSRQGARARLRTWIGPGGAGAVGERPLDPLSPVSGCMCDASFHVPSCPDPRMRRMFASALMLFTVAVRVQHQCEFKAAGNYFRAEGEELI